MSLCTISMLLLLYPRTGLISAEPEKACSMNELVDRAVKRSELIFSMEKDMESIRGFRNQTGSWQNPVISAQAGSKTASGKNGTSYELSAAQPFYFPGRQRLNSDIMGISEKIAGLDLEGARTFVSHSVIKLAYRYAVATELSRHLEERIKRYSAIGKYLSSRPFPSPAKRMEKHIVEMRLSLIRKELDDARSGRDITWARLNAFLDLPAPVKIEVPWFEKGGSLKPDTLLAAMRTGNLDLKKQALILEKTALETRAARRQSLPDFSLSFIYSEDRVSGNTDRFIGGGASASLPLWNTNGDGVRGSEAREEAEKARLEYLRRQQTQVLSASIIEYENAARNLERLPLSSMRGIHARLADADDSFSRGLIDFLTYSEVDSAAYETHLAVLNAQYEYAEKYSDLCILRGEERPDFMAIKGSSEREK
jgi:outer membrane protein TolC